MNEEFTPEKKEFQSKVDLKVVEKHGDKNFMIGFTGNSKDECQAYNWTISDVLKENNLQSFHQVGTSPSGEHEPGYHAWEIWSDSDENQLKSLLPQIEQKAQEMLKSFSE